MSRNWAFVIGINNYVNFAPLRCAKRDAEVMAAFFAQESGFEGVWLFTDDSPAQVLPNGNTISTQPTVGNLVSLLEDRFAEPFLEKGDNCWLFFAGHGGQERNQDFLMPQDANPRAVERTAISVNYIRERLCRCGADNVILLLDACRTEGARDGGGLGVEEQPGIITVSSCGPTERSWEIEALGHGAFTYVLLEALRLSGERNCATVERLGRHLRDRVPALCQQHGKALQRPRIGADPAEKLHFILQPSRATLADITALKNDAYRAELERDWHLAELLWIRVMAVAQGRDMDVVKAFQRLGSTPWQGAAPASVVKPRAATEADRQGARDSAEVQTPGVSKTPGVLEAKPEPKRMVFGLELKRCEFEVVTVDRRGQAVGRKPGQADYFEEDLGGGVALAMVQIPAGQFVMGSPDEEEGRDFYSQFIDALKGVDVEGPQRGVMVPEFFLGRFAITQAQYLAVMGENPSRFTEDGAQRPVEQVSWTDAVAFCEKLSEKSGKSYRLPSEAEWEYACRAGTTTPFHFGETLTPELANYDGNYTYGDGLKGEYCEQTVEVGRFPPNAFGVCEMHGNVFEWCGDRWHRNYLNAPSNALAWTNNGDDGELYILRGGSWLSSPGACRSAYRNGNSPSYRDDCFGFRVACVAPRAV